jgi:hypothetical protein
MIFLGFSAINTSSRSHFFEQNKHAGQGCFLAHCRFCRQNEPRTPFPQKEELKSAYLKLYQNDKTSLILLSL